MVMTIDLRFIEDAQVALLAGRLVGCGPRGPAVGSISPLRVLFRLEQLSALQPEQQEEGRADQQGSRDEDDDDGDEDGIWCRCVGERQAAAGQQAGELGHAPGPYNRCHPEYGRGAQAFRASGDQQGEDGQTAGRRDDDKRKRPVRESVVEGRGRVADL